MNPNNLQQISSFKKHHGKTRAKHLQIQTTVRRAQGWNSDISKTSENTTTLSQTLGRLHVIYDPLKKIFTCHKGQSRGKSF